MSLPALGPGLRYVTVGMQRGTPGRMAGAGNPAKGKPPEAAPGA